jgi:hypothetical protein
VNNPADPAGRPDPLAAILAALARDRDRKVSRWARALLERGDFASGPPGPAAAPPADAAEAGGGGRRPAGKEGVADIEG